MKSDIDVDRAVEARGWATGAVAAFAKRPAPQDLASDLESVVHALAEAGLEVASLFEIWTDIETVNALVLEGERAPTGDEILDLHDLSVAFLRELNHMVRSANGSSSPISGGK